MIMGGRTGSGIGKMKQDIKKSLSNNKCLDRLFFYLKEIPFTLTA